MEPDSKNHPILSYVISRKPLSEPLIGSSGLPANVSDTVLSIDVEANKKKETDEELLVNQMPNLKCPEVLATMIAAIDDVVQARAVLRGLGERPDHEAVDVAQSNIAQIESRLSKRLEDIVMAPRPEYVSRTAWRALQAEEEEEARQAAEKEKFPFKAVIQLYEMHQAYEDLVRDAEHRLVKIYQVESSSEVLPVKDEVNEEVRRLLNEASKKNFQEVQLKGRMLRFLPEAFGKLITLVLLDLSNNQLEILPDSIAGLTNLQRFYLSSNLLVSLPDSIGLLKNLQVLNVSANRLKALPNSISSCSALIELDVSFNQLTYLPTNLGHDLVNLQKLSVHLNKIRSLPSSLCDMQSLRYLDVHFNELRSLPLAIGKLTNLEIMNASNNFTDLVRIPDSIGDLVNLNELDLSNNQIRELPYSFGRLHKLQKLNLDQNPLVCPPMNIVRQGVEAIREHMAKIWLEFLLEEEKRSLSEASDMHSQDSWLWRGGSWFGGWFSALTGNLTEFLGTTNKSHNEDYLEEQL